VAETPDPPRIEPLPRSEWGETEIRALDPMIPPPGSVYAERRKQRGGAGGVNALALMLRNPAACRAFMEFNRHLLYESSLDERVRELVVLRISWRLGSAYEWAQHVPVAKQCGFTDEEIERIREGAVADGWSDLDAALLRATDELLDSGDITDDTWASLAATYGAAALLDLIFTVGGYATLGMVFNAARLPLDADLDSG
jgi:alkylhydroperoxidase family enzyme